MNLAIIGDVLIEAAGKDFASDEDPVATAAFSGAAFALRAAERRGDALAYLRTLAFVLSVAPTWLQPEAGLALRRLVTAGREVYGDLPL